MARWRAVPTAVSTAVGALAFLASAGLAVVLGAGLHVWSGPASTTDLGSRPPSSSSSVTGRVGDVVIVPAPAPPQVPRSGSGGSAPTITLPFLPFAPAAGSSPTTGSPSPSGPAAVPQPSQTGPAAVRQPSSRPAPVGSSSALRTLLAHLLGRPSSGHVAIRSTSLLEREALRAATEDVSHGHRGARDHGRVGGHHKNAHRLGHQQRGRHHAHGHGHHHGKQHQHGHRHG